MVYRVPVIPGDGTGPELMEATRRVLEATGVALQWEEVMAGQRALERYGELIPEVTLKSIRARGVALKGPLTGRGLGTYQSPTVALRQALGLYAIVRPCKTYPGVPSRYQGVDLVVISESTEDLSGCAQFPSESPEARELLRLAAQFSGKAPRPDAAVGLKVISPWATRRVAEFAFRYAQEQGRRQVTVGHKASGTNFTDITFLTAAAEVAQGHPAVQFQEMAIDALCFHLVRHPEELDVLLLPGGYGDLVSDLCAGLIGSIGLAPGANYGEGVAMFEAAHGTAPKYAGLNKANPMALILSGAFLLRHLGEMGAASRVERAVAEVLAEGRDVTYDLKPDRNDPSAASTSQVAEALVRRLRSQG